MAFRIVLVFFLLGPTRGTLLSAMAAMKFFFTKRKLIKRTINSPDNKLIRNKRKWS